MQITLANLSDLANPGQQQVTFIAITAPSSNPPSGEFYVYMDALDNKLKARGPSGTVTVLANP